jgi:hypothetical protein
MSNLIRHHLNKSLDINHNCCQTISDYLGKVTIVVAEVELVIDKFYDNFILDENDFVPSRNTNDHKRWLCLYTPYNQGPFYVKDVKTDKHNNGCVQLRELTLIPHRSSIKIINKQVSLFIDSNLIIGCTIKNTKYKLIYSAFQAFSKKV